MFISNADIKTHSTHGATYLNCKNGRSSFFIHFLKIASKLFFETVKSVLEVIGFSIFFAIRNTVYLTRYFVGRRALQTVLFKAPLLFANENTLPVGLNWNHYCKFTNYVFDGEFSVLVKGAAIQSPKHPSFLPSN